MAETIRTPLCDMFGIKYPIMLAGMNKAAGSKLAAAVTNAGGLGVFGGVNYTPKMLRRRIKQIKKLLVNKDAPFGVDLLLPKVGKGARATNHDYTSGKLDELIDIIIEEKAKLFVSAVGVPPKRVVDRLHAAGIPVMNMIGAPKHVKYALEAGCDIICAQGGEGGGHTGDVATSILIPHVVDMCKGHKSPLTGKPVHVVAAGGIYDGRGLAMALSLGAEAVWVGTRFVMSKEAGASKEHQKAIETASVHDSMRTLVYTGRPLRVKKNFYITDWENNRKKEMGRLLAQGKIPYKADLEQLSSKKSKGEKVGPLQKGLNPQMMTQLFPHLIGQVAGVLNDIQPAKQIIDEMMEDCIKTLRHNTGRIKPVSKL